MTCPFDLEEVYASEPNWPLILVYSDWLEQQNDPDDNLMAVLLRWLYQWDHWPYFQRSVRGPKRYEFWCWWIQSSTYDCRCYRYVKPKQTDPVIEPNQKSFDPLKSMDLRLAQAALPALSLTHGWHKFKSVDAAIQFLRHLSYVVKLATAAVPMPKVSPCFAEHFVYLPREVSLEKAIADVKEAKK